MAKPNGVRRSRFSQRRDKLWRLHRSRGITRGRASHPAVRLAGSVRSRSSADRRGAARPRHGRRLCAGEAAAARDLGLSRGAVRPRDHERDGRARPARRDDPSRIWRRRPRLCQLRPDRPRGRARRQRLPLGDVGAVEPRDVPDLRLRLGGAAAEISAQARDRRMGRLLRPDRARCRVRPGQHAHPRRKDCGRLSPHRHQDVDHQLADRRRVRRLGEVGRAWRQDPRVRARKGHGGPVRARRSRRSSRFAPRSPARS